MSLVSQQDRQELKKSRLGEMEIAQWLRTMTTFPEDLGSVPEPTSHNLQSVTPFPRDMTPSSGLQPHQTGLWYTNTLADKYL